MTYPIFGALPDQPAVRVRLMTAKPAAFRRAGAIVLRQFGFVEQ